MAGTKFSGFSTGDTTGNTFIVGYDTTANTNNQYTLAQLAAGISPHISIDTIYTANASDTSTVPSGREIDLTDNLTVQAGHGVYFSVNNTVAGYGDLRLTPPTTSLGSVGALSGSVVGNLLRVRTTNRAIAIGRDSATYVSINKPGTYFWQNTIAALEVASPTATLPAIVARAGSDVSTGISFKSINNSGNTLLEITGDGVAKYTGQAYTELHDTTNATLTVNWNNGNIQELTSLTGSLTFTASNPKAGATLTLAQTGTVTATWTGVKFPGATAPTLSGAGKTDVITLICYDAAANSGAGAYYGSSVLNFTT